MSGRLYAYIGFGVSNNVAIKCNLGLACIQNTPDNVVALGCRSAITLTISYKLLALHITYGCLVTIYYVSIFFHPTCL